MAYATGNHGVRGRTVTFGRLIAFIFTAAIASTLVMHNRIFSHCATTQIATFDVSKEWLPTNNDHDHFAQRISSSVAPQREEQHGSIIHDSNNDRGQFSFEFKNVFERINQNQDAPAIINKPPPEDTWILSTSHDIHASSFNGKIPKIINKIYYQKDGQFQDGNETAAFGKLKEAHKSWQLMNPGYDVRYFNLQSSRKYLQRYFHPVFLRTFDCIEAFAGKSDFFRLALLYHEGGWHSDWKQECLESNVLDKISDETDVVRDFCLVSVILHLR